MIAARRRRKFFTISSPPKAISLTKTTQKCQNFLAAYRRPEIIENKKGPPISDMFLIGGAILIKGAILKWNCLDLQALSSRSGAIWAQTNGSQKVLFGKSC